MRIITCAALIICGLHMPASAQTKQEPPAR